MLNLDVITNASVIRDPFDFFVADGVVGAECQNALTDEFPSVADTGSFPVSQVTFGPVFRTLVDELSAPSFGRAVGNQLGFAVDGLPQLMTVRGRSGPKDGFVHTDAEWKLVTVLLYLNPEWNDTGGRLRLLRSADLDDVAVEVSPRFGTLVAFRRSDRSFHGHHPFLGERRVVQVNWVANAADVAREERRHRRSAVLKTVAKTLHSGWGRGRSPDADRHR